MNIKQKIARLKQQIRLRETADDGYYLSRQYKEDARALYELERQLPPAGTPRQPSRPQPATAPDLKPHSHPFPPV